MCLTFQAQSQSEQKESIIKISRSEQTDRNQVMIGRSHSGDRALMLLLVLRSFFPVPGNFTPPPVFWLLISFSLVFSVKSCQWKSKFSTVGLWLEGPPPVIRIYPPVSCWHAEELHRFCCHINSCTCKPARVRTASVNSQPRLCRNHIWWDRRSDRQPARCSLFPSDLFQRICKVTGFHQGNQLERALVECLTIPPCFPGRWRSLLVNIISVAVVLDGAALYWIRAKAYKIPFSTGKVIFPTAVISERLISKVGLQRRAAAAGRQWIIHQGMATAGPPKFQEIVRCRISSHLWPGAEWCHRFCSSSNIHNEQTSLNRTLIPLQQFARIRLNWSSVECGHILESILAVTVQLSDN